MTRQLHVHPKALEWASGVQYGMGVCGQSVEVWTNPNCPPDGAFLPDNPITDEDATLALPAIPVMHQS